MEVKGLKEWAHDWKPLVSVLSERTFCPRSVLNTSRSRAAFGSLGSHAERGDCSPVGALETHRDGHSTCFVPLEGCCTWLARLYLQMFSGMSAGRGHREYQQCGLCSNDAAGRGPGQVADFRSVVHAKRRLLHLVGRGLRSGLPGGFPLPVPSYSSIPHQKD